MHWLPRDIANQKTQQRARPAACAPGAARHDARCRALATALAEAAAAPLPAMLTVKTVQAALVAVAGKLVAGGCLTARAVVLAEEAVRGMVGISKLVGLVLAVGVVVGGAGWAGYRTSAVMSRFDGRWLAATRSGAADGLPLRAIVMDQYGDPLPEGAVARLGTTRLRHSGTIYAVVFSPDGRLVASTHSHGEARIWDVATGKKVHALVDPFGGVARCASFSPDGKLFATDKGIPGVWEVATGKLLRRLEGKHTGYVTSMMFAPDGRSIVLGTSDDKSIWFHDPATGKAIRRLEGHTAAVLVAVYSKDGNKLATGSKDETARVWDLSSEKILRQFAHSEAVLDVALSPDDKLLATQTGKAISVWSIVSGEKVHDFASPGELRSLAFSPDGKILASATDHWDMSTGKKVWECKDNSGYPTAFSPDGKIVALGGFNGVLGLYDTASGKELPQSSAGWNRGAFTSIRFTPDGKQLITAGNDGTALLDIATRQPLYRLRYQLGSPAISSDNKVLATITLDRDILVADAKTGREIRRINAKTPNGNPGLWPVLVFSPEGTTLASAGYGNIIRQWDAQSGKELRQFKGHEKGVYSLVFSRDGKTLIATDLDKVTRFWDIASGQQHSLLREGYIRGISPDRKLCAIGQEGGGLRICGLINGQEVCRLNDASSNWCVFSPDGKTVAGIGRDLSGPETERTIQLIEVATAKVRAEFHGHHFGISDAAFSPDGRTLVTAGYDSTCLIWDMTGGRREGEVPPNGWSSKKLDDYWSDLGSADAAKAYQAIWALAAVPKQTLASARRRLQQVPSVNEKKITQWVADLDSTEFNVRQKASKALEELEDIAEGPLTAALGKEPSLEGRTRIEQLLKKINAPVTSPKRLEALRTIEILERIGSPEAKAVLKTLAGGVPGARETEEAKASLERLNGRTGAVR